MKKVIMYRFVLLLFISIGVFQCDSTEEENIINTPLQLDDSLITGYWTVYTFDSASVPLQRDFIGDYFEIYDRYTHSDQSTSFNYISVESFLDGNWKIVDDYTLMLDLKPYSPPEGIAKDWLLSQRKQQLFSHFSGLFQVEILDEKKIKLNRGPFSIVLNKIREIELSESADE